MSGDGASANKLSRWFAIFLCIVLPIGLFIIARRHYSEQARYSAAKKVPRILSKANHVLELADGREEPMRSKSLKKAFKHVKKCFRYLDKAECPKDTRIHAWTHMLLMQLAFALKDIDSTKHHFGQAMEIHKKIGGAESLFKGQCWKYFGWKRQGVLDDFYNSSQLARGEDFWILCQETLAEVHVKEGAADRALGLRKKIVAHVRLYCGIGQPLARALRDLAKVYIDNGYKKEAKKTEDEAAKIARLASSRMFRSY